MDYFKKFINSPYPVIIFFLAIFGLSIIPLRDFDIWFHLKSGEIIAKMGLIHVDVFSHSAAGREWFPYEWLFQIIVYFIKEAAGFESIKYFTAVVILIQIIIFYNILRSIFSLNRILSASLSFIFFVSVYEFYSARPHVLAYTFLIAFLYLIYLFYFKGKNYLYLTVPVTLMWANLHGSIFLAPYLLGAYTILSYVTHKSDEAHVSHESHGKILKGRWKVFGIYTVITAVLAIMPPLGILQYRLLWIFFRENSFISKFIDEWVPLTENTLGLIFYTSSILVVAAAAVTAFKKIRNKTDSFWILPLLPLILLGFMANRNVFLGYIALILILGWSIALLKDLMVSRKLKVMALLLLVILITGHIIELNWKRTQTRFYYPVAAAQFIKKYLKGNMFNEYGYGGYLLYQLYPQQKVFIDGRTDVYLCCEMRDMLNIAVFKNLPDDEYGKTLYSIWDKYKISFVVVRTQKHQVLRKIARLLTDDPNWSLVFWDDYTQVFARRDGKNDQVIAGFGANAATPYNRNPYREGKTDEAEKEYQNMLKVVDSAKSRNALGYIMMQKGQYNDAKEEFLKAVVLDPQFESPYMNLAEISVHDGDLRRAIALYEAAKNNAPDRGLIYIRLGQLYIQNGESKEKALEIWREGIKNTVDDDARERLKKMISV